MSVVFFVTGGIALAVALAGAIVVSDPGQLLFRMPRSFGLALLARRTALLNIGLGAFAVSMVLGIVYEPVTFLVLVVYAVLFALNLFFGFYAEPWIIFPSQQNTARYMSIGELDESFEGDVFVVEVNGEATAYPRRWMIRPHAAGDNVGGEGVTLTYCGLSHLGMAYRNDQNENPLDLIVVGQFENNLVFFDRASGDVVTQIYGKLVKSGRVLEQVPVISMPFESFKQLYPDGKVYHNPPRGVADRFFRFALDAMLYRKNGQYDPENDDLIFKTIKYTDRRIPAKELVYGVANNGQAVAFTYDYLRQQQDGSVVENIGGRQMTVKYFKELDFVDVFEGVVKEVGPEGRLPDETEAQRFPHASRVLWIIWRNFYPATDIRVAA